MTGDAVDLAMFKDPTSWPMWPWLPVKQRQEASPPLCGIVFADHVDGPFIICEWAGIRPTTTPLLTYDSAEAAFDAGWVVD